MIVHPQTKLIREPRLLVPWQKPVGAVKAIYPALNWFSFPWGGDIARGAKGTESGIFAKTKDSLLLATGYYKNETPVHFGALGKNGKTVVIILRSIGSENVYGGSVAFGGPTLWIQFIYGSSAFNINYNGYVAGVAHSIQVGDFVVAIGTFDGISTFRAYLFSNGQYIGTGTATQLNRGDTLGLGGIANYWECSSWGYMRRQTIMDWGVLDVPHNEAFVFALARDPYQFLIPA